MKNVQYCYRVLFAAAFVLLLSTVMPASALADQDAANDKAQAAGERAHFAQAFCQVPPERVAAYRQRLRKVLHDASDFDRYWQVGWRRAEKDDSQMSALRDRDPAEFAARIKVNCERLKWMAQNSLRSAPRQ